MPCTAGVRPWVYPSSIQTTEILYATDFSEPARRALACAKQIARRRRALLRALHVIELTGHGSGSTHASFNAAIEGARRRMRTMRRELRLAGITEDSTIIPAGSISLAIRDAIVRYHCSMLVMGLHGEPGVMVPTFGGNVRRLFRTAPCPILTVGLRGTNSDEPALERVLFVTDMFADSVTAAKQAWPPDKAATPVGHCTVLPPEDAPDAFSALDPPPSLAALRVLAHHQAAALVVAQAEQERADLVVVAMHGDGYLDSVGSGSVIRTILSKAPCPVLTARAAGEPLAPLRERFAAVRDQQPEEL